MATEFKIPLLKLAHKEQGFFSLRISKTISLIWEVSSTKGIPISAQVFCKKEESKKSKPELILIAIKSNFFG